ncbi:MAG: diguanylate cyclase domain-containing protein, partial [Acidimicrobiales bacterium]
MIDHAVEGEHRAGVDLAWIVVVASLVCAAAIYWQIPDRLLARLDEFDRWNVNGILALIVVVPLGATLFAMRRYRDAVGAQEELSRLSMHDALTGLPNRRHLREVMPQALRHARRRNTRAAVLFLDLDGFKTVNDTYGHEVGDRLMTAVARRIRDGAGPGRLTARYAGDEFVVVDPEPVTADHASRLGRELVELVETPFELGEDRITVSASVGVAFGDSSSDPEELIRNADVAMYEAKRSTDRVAVFDTGMRAGITPVNAERRLEAALAAGQFRLLYQPIVA